MRKVETHKEHKKAYGVLDPSKLPFNVYADVVEDEFPEEELA